MKLTKKHMTKFDFVAKRIFFFTMLGLVLTIAFVLPLKGSLTTKCNDLVIEVQSLENDKTVLFISHRLSTTVMADEIYMLEKGEIIEHGSHEELMKLDGKYAYMFKLQAEKYN